MSATNTEVLIRSLRPADFDAVVDLDELLTEERKEAYWDGVLARFLDGEGHIGLAAMSTEGGDGALLGFLFAEVRAFEFGSEVCGWIFAVAVHPDAGRTGVASALLAEAGTRFHKLGVTAVRTMVRRLDVPLLSFFRRNGFVGGPFVQLELARADAGAELPAEGAEA